MRAVKQDGRLTFKQFQPPGVARCSRSLRPQRAFRNLKALPSQRLCESNGDRRIGNLMSPAQPQQHVFVSRFLCFKRDSEATIICNSFDPGLALVHVRLDVRFRTPPQDHLEGLSGCGAIIAVTPGRMIAAFSAAISSSVSPRYS